ncbi:hypothetical protein Tco_0311628, partial [Tanacetum coccineum]
MNGWIEKDDDINENVNDEDVEDEDVEDEDVEMEVDDEAELIFPYESSDIVSSDSESEDEEADIAPGPTGGTATQRPFAIRDFLKGMYEVGEPSDARDSSCVGGLEPWALRRDLETTHTRARLIEAEVGTNRTETALLDSKIKIGEKERKILDYDLGNVVERLKILESGENANLKRKLDETETRLAWARMERDTAKRSLHESTGWNRRFYWEMVRKGAVPKPPSDDEDDGRSRKKSKKSDKDDGRSRKKSKKSDKDDGPFEPRGPP